MSAATQELFESAEVTNTREVKGVLVPDYVGFRQIVVTGPPCSGKSTLVENLGGWPEEAYIDLALNKWWQSTAFTFRPREIHFGFPFFGFDVSHSVFDREWLQAPADIDFSRVLLPPGKRGIFSIDWRNRYAFDFQLIPAEQIFASCQKRKQRGSHHMDAELTMEVVQRAVRVYKSLALYFHENGMLVYFRDRYEGNPRRFECRVG
ncbi:serine/threonine protein phosphatase [Pseudomonadota bacterium]